MIFGKEKELKSQIISIGKKLADLRLVTATAGNLSARLNEDTILITATGTSLGGLKEDDIIKADITKEETRARLSTEFPLHRLIYQSFPAQTVIHCHPPLINGYFAVYAELKTLTFESKLYLGNVPVVPQETPSITKPQAVIEALKTNNLVVIKNHGVVAMADEFKKGLDLIGTLEEAVKVAATARLFDKGALDGLDAALKEDLTRKTDMYPMFSREHIQAIVELVNHDEFIAKKGQEMGLTLKLAIKIDGDNRIYKFNFEKGRITALEFDEDAPFIICAPADVWEMVFLGKLDPFVATTQGKMKLKGDLGKLSRWYVPFSRLFELFKAVKIK
ncbi:MAG: class II aldolase/adducin family protein [Candidatus Omnitrophica bacterium]|nr:class II aldolase/adducin family protein [Candidatus Omnitrophota bacterium]